MQRLLLLFLLACASTGEPEITPDGPGGKADGNEEVQDFCNATDPRTVPVEIVATPEAGEAPYLTALQSAQESIDLQVYLMGYGGILDTLRAKAAAGVTVRVMLDREKIDTNQKYYDMLAAAGVQVKWSDDHFVFTHSKYFIVDDAVAVMSTGNYSKSFSIERERNHVATDRDPADLIDLRTLFDADWAGTGPSVAMPCTRMVIAPINARQRIIDLINSAEDTLEIESMHFGDPAVRAAVKARVEAGVTVRVMLADANWIDANVYASQYLKDLGVPVKWMPHLHTKMIVADGARAYVGSENLSTNSLDNNREVGVIVTEASSIAPLTTSFETDWTAGTAF